MLQANYFNGRSSRVRAVNLSVAGEDLVVAGEDIDLRVPFAKVKVDERLGRAPRRLRLEDGAFCEVRGDGILVRQSSRGGWPRGRQGEEDAMVSAITTLPQLRLASLGVRRLRRAGVRRP